MRTGLMLAGGLFWTATYLLIIWRGFADKTYGMPLVALAANVSWEFIFAFVHPAAPMQRTVNIVWLVFDLVILYTFLRFGRAEFPRLSKAAFYAMTVTSFVLAYLGVWLFSVEFDNGRATYAAYAQNLMMSALFLGMLLQRGSLRGQSVGIAACKMLGTAVISLAVWRYDEGRDTDLLVYLYLGTLLLDLIYLVAVFLVKRGAAKPLASPPSRRA